MKNNLISLYNKNRINQNTKNINYNRCASVEEKHNNNNHFSQNLEKEFLNVKFLVKNSVERINTLFNNEEFKQKTISKRLYNNLSKTVNIKSNLNKEYNLEDNNINKDSNINSLNIFINSPKDKNKILFNRSTVIEEDEFINNSNDLFNDLKELNSNKSINNDNNKIISINAPNNNDYDSINGSLLNLQSNKLYSNKEKNFNLKKINISDNSNSSLKNKNNNYKNTLFSKNLKTENQNDLIGFKEKKKDILKYIQKGNNLAKKCKLNNNDVKTRNNNKPKVFYDKYNVEEANKFTNTQKLKNFNKSLKKENDSRKKHYSNKVLNDIKININADNININKISEQKGKKEVNKLLSSFEKYSNEGQKSEIYINNFGKNDNEKNNKKKYFNGIKKKNILKNSETNKTINNILEPLDLSNKIKTQDFLKMMLLLNEYLINNNLFEDFSNPKNKEILNNYSLFLANNISNNFISPNKTNNDNNNVKAAIKIQRKWRKIKIEKHLINNFKEEDSELKKMLMNNIIQKPNFKNNKIIDTFKNIINNCKLFDNNNEDIEKLFYQIQKIIQRKLNINEKNLIYKEYINKNICNK